MEASALTTASSVSGLRGPSALLRLQSDERLIALTRRGHHAAFETLCSRYQSRLLAFCRHMLGSREDAEDVLQEVFAAAFNAVLADEREINVRPWLYRIARNRSLNHLRRNSATGMDSMDVFLSEGGISTGEKVLRREGFRELIGDVHQLPETQRTALLLREIDALSYEQIAQAMDTTVPSVKSLLVRARISLAEAAEARKLSCDEVRLELGQAAEGLLKLSTPARRHVRDCDRCASFKRHLKENNKALAAIFPIGPLLAAKKLLFAKLGSAGGAHVSAGASVGASASAGAGAGAGAAAGAAAGGGSVAGGLVTAGAGALATKAVAGLAAAAIVTAGAVAADNSGPRHHHHLAGPATYASVSAHDAVVQPVIVAQQSQPASAGPAVPNRPRATLAKHRTHLAKAATPLPPVTTTPATTPPAPVVAPAAATPDDKVNPDTTQVTEVTSSTTQLPAAATTTTTTQTTTTTTPVTPPPVTTTPVTTTGEAPPPPTPETAGREVPPAAAPGGGRSDAGDGSGETGGVQAPPSE